MSEFQNTNIQIIKVEAKMASTGNMKYILTAHNNKKYYFYQKNKGVDCDVFQVFNNMEVKQGSTIAIGFTEEAKTFTGKDGKPVTYTDRFIGSMREADGVPAAQAQKIAPQPKYEATNEDKGTNWDEIAVGKCQSLFIAAFIQSGKTFSEAKLQVTQARQLAELVVYGQQQAQTDDAPLPTETGEINVENIPF